MYIHKIYQSTGGTLPSSQLLVRVVVVVLNTKFILFSFAFFSTSLSRLSILIDESTLQSIFFFLSLCLELILCRNYRSRNLNTLFTKDQDMWDRENQRKRKEGKKEKKKHSHVMRIDVFECPSIEQRGLIILCFCQQYVALSEFNQAIDGSFCLNNVSVMKGMRIFLLRLTFSSNRPM